MDSPVFRKKLLEKIKTAREKANLTQAQLAEKVGMSSNHYAMFERGESRTTDEYLFLIGKVLGIKLIDLK